MHGASCVKWRLEVSDGGASSIWLSLRRLPPFPFFNQRIGRNKSRSFEWGARDERRILDAFDNLGELGIRFMGRGEEREEILPPLEPCGNWSSSLSLGTP